MRVLVCHVHYREAGGEDVVFANEIGLLRSRGLDVATVELNSADLVRQPPLELAHIALSYEDHAVGRRIIRDAVRLHRPDVVHYHNIYPLLGPGAIDEAARIGCATVQTIHNFRLSCLNGRHFLGADFCSRCRPTRLSAGVWRRCYRGSLLQSFLSARATRRQWHDFTERSRPHLWLTLTPFMRDYLIGFGAPGDRILAKPNSVAAGSPRPREERTGVFFGGRLSPEKGVLPLVRTWPADAPVLTVAGHGPLEADVRAAAKANVRYVGQLESDRMREHLRTARVVAIPSLCPEQLPLVALEAFSEGTPVVAFGDWSRGSAIRALSPRCVVDRRSFPDFIARTKAIHDAPDWAVLGARSQALWRERYSHPVNVSTLLDAYDHAIALKGRPPMDR